MVVIIWKTVKAYSSDRECVNFNHIPSVPLKVNVFSLHSLYSLSLSLSLVCLSVSLSLSLVCLSVRLSLGVSLCLSIFFSQADKETTVVLTEFKTQTSIAPTEECQCFPPLILKHFAVASTTKFSFMFNMHHMHRRDASTIATITYIFSTCTRTL